MTPVDTTGAGDCFTGTLAAFLAEGRSLAEATGLAAAAGALSVQARGTVGLLRAACRRARLRGRARPGLGGAAGRGRRLRRAEVMFRRLRPPLANVEACRPFRR